MDDNDMANGQDQTGPEEGGIPLGWTMKEMV